MSFTNTRPNPAAVGLAGLASLFAPQGQASEEAKAEKKQSEHWLNIVVTIPGGAEDGSDLSVSLPVGIALDDAKLAPVKGSGKFAQLAQTKNALLQACQTECGNLEPGERKLLPPVFRVEMYRKQAPQPQTGTVTGNDLTAKLFGAIGASARAQAEEQSE